MDRSISAAEANRHFSSVLSEVRDGKSFIVTNHGKPVARIVPAGRDDAFTANAREALLSRLAAQPVIDVGRWSRDDLYEDEA